MCYCRQTKRGLHLLTYLRPAYQKREIEKEAGGGNHNRPDNGGPNYPESKGYQYELKAFAPGTGLHSQPIEIKGKTMELDDKYKRPDFTVEYHNSNVNINERGWRKQRKHIEVDGQGKLAVEDGRGPPFVYNYWEFTGDQEAVMPFTWNGVNQFYTCGGGPIYARQGSPKCRNPQYFQLIGYRS
ncbi:hypothetical protein B0I71DRAFT_153091 [Yarrowia lipolytica]|uniref:Uncharacterized protein n=1 Tax=Yarrowia lipolytica TaxID=4952 RepID=A0A371C6G2_YARLL|nr:hypothetical protein B0I71DRAFT_153091 [Yarrowia lipolytica]